MMLIILACFSQSAGVSPSQLNDNRTRYLTGSHHSTPISTQLCLQGFSRLYSFLSADTTDDPARWIRSTYIDPPKTGLQETVKTLSRVSLEQQQRLIATYTTLEMLSCIVSFLRSCITGFVLICYN